MLVLPWVCEASLHACRKVLPPSRPCTLAGRMTLLLGPPSGGKSVLLQALSGRLRPRRNLRVGAAATPACLRSSWRSEQQPLCTGLFLPIYRTGCSVLSSSANLGCSLLPPPSAHPSPPSCITTAALAYHAYYRWCADQRHHQVQRAEPG